MPPATAATTANPALTNAPLNTFISQVETQILVPLVTLLALASFIVFVWGVIGYIQGSGDPEARAKGNQHIIWGFIGLLIIFGATAIVSIIQAFANVFLQP